MDTTGIIDANVVSIKVNRPGFFKRVVNRVKGFVARLRAKREALAGAIPSEARAIWPHIKTFMQWYSWGFMLAFTLMVAAMMGVGYFIWCALFWWGITSLITQRPRVVYLPITARF